MNPESRAAALGPEPAPSWTETLLASPRAPSWREEGQRLLIAAGLAALFGVALGLRDGGVAIAVHAFGVPAGILAVTGLAVPALAILLALANAPIEILALAKASSQAAITAGLILGGLAPAAAMFTVTVEDAITVSIIGFGCMLLAGGLSVRSFYAELVPQLANAPPRTRRHVGIVLYAFVVFACVLALRMWWITLPILTRFQ